MNFETLHICLVGLHPLKSYENITSLVTRIRKFNTQNINLKINILHDTTDKESFLLKDKFASSTLKDDVEWVEYDSKFLKSGRKFLSRNYASLIVQNEPMEYYVSHDIPENDFILRCRSDYYLTDEFLKMILDREFFKRLDNSNEKVPIFKNKLWMPYIGAVHFLDCCDYFYITSVKDQRDVLIVDPSEAESLWLDPWISPDRSHLPPDQNCFAERIFFIKPLLNFLRENNINSVSSNYWELVHSNFSFGGDPSPIKTCFYGWRGSAWCPGTVGYKVAEGTSRSLVAEHALKISDCSKITPNAYQISWLPANEYIY